MNNKELSKHLYGLTLHALLVTAFGLILMLIGWLAEVGAGLLHCPSVVFIKAVQVALEVPFLLAVLSLVVTESREPVTVLSCVASNALAHLRRHPARRPPRVRAGCAHSGEGPHDRNVQ